MSPRAKLLSVIALLVLTLGTLLFFIFRDSPEENPALTTEQLSRYQTGTHYRTIVASTVQGQISDKDWGLEKKVTLVHQGELDFIREVKSTSTDHSEVTLGLEILSARDLEVRLSLDDATLDLPPAVGVLSKTARRFLLTTPEGIAFNLAADRATDWLRSDKNRQKVLSRLDTSVKLLTGSSLGDHLLSAKFQPLEAYEGLTADYTYTAGQGLTTFETGATLNQSQEARVKDLSVYSEAYLLPNPSGQPGDEWEVDVQNIAHLLAPSQDLHASGTLTFRRGEQNGTALDLTIVQGKVAFSGGSDTRLVLGTWAARGLITYDLATHSIAEGSLSGDVTLERRSTDHFLFEESFRSEPTYHVAIKGFASQDPVAARRELSNLTLDR